MFCSMWQCVIKCVVPDFWKEHHAFFFKGQTDQKVTVWPFKWGPYIALKYCELVTQQLVTQQLVTQQLVTQHLFTQQHGVTYQKAWILSDMTTRM